MGIDFGEVRIGLALSDPLQIISQPFRVISNNDNTISEIQNIIKMEDVEKIILGLPQNLDGEDTKKTLEVREFAEILKNNIDVPVIFWDERYSSNDFVYGTKPNTFFKDELDKLKTGNILLLGEGEGRNAIYAAVKGWNVDAVDFSIIAKEKALKLAEENSVSINYEIIDLSQYKPKANYYDAAAIILLPSGLIT